MTTPITLRIAVGPYAHVQALKDGSVRSERVRLDFIEVEPITRAFRRMARDLEFDVSEMAITTHALAHAFRKPITALPIVLSRGFHHGTIVCAHGSAIRGPADLAGRKVGVRAWSQTTGVWVRGILKSDYGIEPAAMTTVTEEDAHVREYQDPPHVVRAAAGKTLRGMLLAGEIDAAIALRPAPDPKEVRTVIPDADAATAAWYRKTGVYPVNHGVVVKNALLTADPSLAVDLFAAFKAAKEIYLTQLREGAARTPPDDQARRLAEVVGGDPFPLGINANRKAIETIVDFTVEQRVIPRRLGIEELFAPGTLELA